jgi:hypothetical protein
MSYNGNNITAIGTHGRLVYVADPYPVGDYVNDSPPSIIATYIVGQSLMSVPTANNDWPLYISNLPDTPNNAAVIFNSSPVKDARIMSDGDVIQHYGFEILLRCTSDEDGWEKCNILSSALDIIRNHFVTKGDNTYKIHNVTRLGGIGSLGNEPNSKRRKLFSMNFITSITKI